MHSTVAARRLSRVRSTGLLPPPPTAPLVGQAATLSVAVGCLQESVPRETEKKPGTTRWGDKGRPQVRDNLLSLAGPPREPEYCDQVRGSGSWHQSLSGSAPL